MRRTKTVTILFLSLLCIVCSRVDKSLPIWGMWNIGTEKSAIFNGENSLGYFAVTPERFSFDPGKSSNPRITQQGYAFTIERIVGEFPLFDLSLTIEENRIVGNKPPKILKGHIKMQFINTNEMWLESFHNSLDSEGFPTSVFQGSSAIYWRAKKLKKKLVDPSGSL
jgi:hypothetical protein